MLLGPPASGKGTLADRLQSECGLATVSPGNLLRAELAAGTELGRRADAQTSRGLLVDDDTINEIVATWLRSESGNGFVFDGYPRTIGQADSLNATLSERRTGLERVLLLDASFSTLLDRVSKRAICAKCGNIVAVGLHVSSFEAQCPRCGGELVRRRDDSEETLRLRLQEYEAKTAPLIDYYMERNLLSRIDANQSTDGVFRDAAKYLA